MVLWQADLRVSWRAQWFSLLMHGIVALFILLLPWSLNYTLIWMLLMSIVVFDCVRSQRRINNRQGTIKLLDTQQMHWQDLDWDIIATPWIVNSGIMLKLQCQLVQRRQYLWLASDSMNEDEWRALRVILQQQFGTPGGQ